MRHIYYHKADLDGISSAAILFLKYEDTDTKYFPVDYDECPLTLDPDAETIFVDFSPEGTPPKELPKNLRVLDHHRTSEGYPGIIDTTRAACQIVWADTYPGVFEPPAITRIGKADTWQTDDPEWESHISPYCLALHAEKWDIGDPRWQNLFEYDTATYFELLDLGRKYVKFLDGIEEVIAKEQSFTTFFAGLRFIAAIGGSRGSHRFKSVFDPAKHDACMMIRKIKVGWRYSMYANDREDLDLSAIARTYGGGGHAGAAGFMHNDLLV